MAELIEIIQLTGPSAILILVGLVWGKKLIEYYYDSTIELKKLELSQNLESFKKNLEQENKDFQHQLDKTLSEFNIRFSKLHQDRAEVIKELYKRLVELQSAMFVFTRTMQPIVVDSEKENQERVERVNKALFEFNNYFYPNKIFFSNSLATNIQDLLKKYWDKGWDFAFINRQYKERNLPHDLFKEYLDKSNEISKEVESEFPTLILELEMEFRKILGVE